MHQYPVQQRQIMPHLIPYAQNPQSHIFDEILPPLHLPKDSQPTLWIGLLGHLCPKPLHRLLMFRHSLSGQSCGRTRAEDRLLGSERVAFVFRADQLAARVACSDCCWVRCRAPNSVDDWLMPVPVWEALDEAG